MGGVTTFDLPPIQYRSRLRGRGETGYELEPSVKVTVLACGHETTDGYASPGPASKGKGHWYWCESPCRRWRRAA